MDTEESAPVWFGPVQRSVGKRDSAVLAQLPESQYPKPDPACATCPAKSWYLSAKRLHCWCKEHRFISWTSNEDPVIACDEREKLIEDDNADTGQNG